VVEDGYESQRSISPGPPPLAVSCSHLPKISRVARDKASSCKGCLYLLNGVQAWFDPGEEETTHLWKLRC
jgi:hypothetical protein